MQSTIYLTCEPSGLLTLYNDVKGVYSECQRHDRLRERIVQYNHRLTVACEAIARAAGTHTLHTLHTHYTHSTHSTHSTPDTRIIRGHRLPISRYRDKLFATYRGQIAVLKMVDFFYNTRFS